jgi:FtsZ-interacting cell division protein ZipA
MNILIFLGFIAVCAIVLMWANSRRTARELEMARKKKAKAKRTNTDLLKTPADYTLSRPDQPWHARQHQPTTGVVATNAFAPKSEAPAPEYDGFSRRDRHHVRDRNARIKKESHAEEPRMRTVGPSGGRTAH